MKKTIILLLVGILITSCKILSTSDKTFQVVSKNQNYNENISFEIDKIVEGKSIAIGGGSIQPNRGNKLVFVFLTLKNNTNKKQELSFENFNLLNKKTKTKHKVEWAMKTGLINLTGKIDTYLKKNEKMKRKLVFIFPEQDRGKFLMVNNRMIEIEYSK